jgi:uncharacterized protein
MANGHNRSAAPPSLDIFTSGASAVRWNLVFREQAMRALLSLILTMWLLSPLHAQTCSKWTSDPNPQPLSVEEALEFAKSSRFDCAFPAFKKHAEDGNLEAMYHLGIMYSYGEGMKKPNKKEAIAWWLRAAKSGHAASQNDLGALYSKGEGVKANKKEAARWFRASAEQGYRWGSEISR